MRPPSWPEALRDYVVAASDRPWSWGEHDCCSFARGAVIAVGGPDLGGGWVGTYATEDGARAAILARGRDLEYAVEPVARGAGLAEVNPLMAHRGDLLILRDQRLIGGMPVAAICEGRDAVTVALHGLIRLPMRLAQRAWAI